MLLVVPNPVPKRDGHRRAPPYPTRTRPTGPGREDLNLRPRDQRGAPVAPAAVVISQANSVRRSFSLILIRRDTAQGLPFGLYGLNTQARRLRYSYPDEVRFT